MQYFDNLDELIDQYLPDQNHDDLIADLVMQANSAINQHYCQYQSELQADRNIQPIITIDIHLDDQKTTPIQVQYFNSDDENKRITNAQVVRILNHEIECPIYTKEGN